MSHAEDKVFDLRWLTTLLVASLFAPASSQLVLRQHGPIFAHSVCPLHSSAKPCVSFRKQLTYMQNPPWFMATPVFCFVCRIPRKRAYHLGSLYYFMCDWLLVWHTYLCPDTLTLVVNITRYWINVTWKEGKGKTETGLSLRCYTNM